MVSLQGLWVANRRRGKFGEPFVNVHTSFLPNEFSVRRITRALKKVVFTKCDPGGSFYFIYF